MGTSARELNRINRVGGVKSGRFEEIERPRGSAGWRPGGQPEMGENLGNNPGLFDSGDDLEVAATVRAMFHVDIEYPFE